MVRKIQNVDFAHYLVQGFSTMLKAQWGVAWLGRIKVGHKQNSNFNCMFEFMDWSIEPFQIQMYPNSKKKKDCNWPSPNWTCQSWKKYIFVFLKIKMILVGFKVQKLNENNQLFIYCTPWLDSAKPLNH